VLEKEQTEWKGKLSFQYDERGTILYISKCPSYLEQETEELGDDVGSLGSNPKTNDIESLEILFSRRVFLRGDLFRIAGDGRFAPLHKLICRKNTRRGRFLSSVRRVSFKALTSDG